MTGVVICQRSFRSYPVGVSLSRRVTVFTAYCVYRVTRSDWLQLRQIDGISGVLGATSDRAFFCVARFIVKQGTAGYRAEKMENKVGTFFRLGTRLTCPNGGFLVTSDHDHCCAPVDFPSPHCAFLLLFAMCRLGCGACKTGTSQCRTCLCQTRTGSRGSTPSKTPTRLATAISPNSTGRFLLYLGLMYQLASFALPYPGLQFRVESSVCSSKWLSLFPDGPDLVSAVRLWWARPLSKVADKESDVGQPPCMCPPNCRCWRCPASWWRGSRSGLPPASTTCATGAGKPPCIHMPRRTISRNHVGIGPYSRHVLLRSLVKGLQRAC